jgi:hypothetical protein
MGPLRLFAIALAGAMPACAYVAGIPDTVHVIDDGVAEVDAAIDGPAEGASDATASDAKSDTTNLADATDDARDGG